MKHLKHLYTLVLIFFSTSIVSQTDSLSVLPFTLDELQKSPIQKVEIDIENEKVNILYTGEEINGTTISTSLEKGESDPRLFLCYAYPESSNSEVVRGDCGTVNESKFNDRYQRPCLANSLVFKGKAITPRSFLVYDQRDESISFLKVIGKKNVEGFKMTRRFRPLANNEVYVKLIAKANKYNKLSIALEDKSYFLEDEGKFTAMLSGSLTGKSESLTDSTQQNTWIKTDNGAEMAASGSSTITIDKLQSLEDALDKLLSRYSRNTIISSQYYDELHCLESAIKQQFKVKKNEDQNNHTTPKAFQDHEKEVLVLIESFKKIKDGQCKTCTELTKQDSKLKELQDLIKKHKDEKTSDKEKKEILVKIKGIQKSLNSVLAPHLPKPQNVVSNGKKEVAKKKEKVSIANSQETELINKKASTLTKNLENIYDKDDRIGSIGAKYSLLLTRAITGYIEYGFQFTVPNKDEFTLSLKDTKRDTAMTIFKKTINVSGGFKIDFSSGFILHGLSDYEYSLRAQNFNYKESTFKIDTLGNIDTSFTGSIKSVTGNFYDESNKNFSYALGVLVHGYPRTGRALNVGFTSGLLLDDDRFRFLIGGSLLFKSNTSRITLSGGAILGTIKRIDPQYTRFRWDEKLNSTNLYNSLDEIPHEYTDITTFPTIEKMEVSWFLGLTYNFASMNINKSVVPKE